MYGWRAKVGLVIPSSNTVSEAEFTTCLPEGTSLHTARMYLEDATAEGLKQMASEVERCFNLLGTADIDLVAYNCTTGTMVKGDGYAETLQTMGLDVAEAPTVTTAGAIECAFDTLDVKSLAVATPYNAELNEREKGFLSDTYDVVDMKGLGIDDNVRMGEVPPEKVYRQVTCLDHESADAVFVSCANYRTIDIIPTLEADLDKPVVTSNQATLWKTLEELGINEKGLGPGILFNA